MKLVVLLLSLLLLRSFAFNPMSQSIELGENQRTAQFLIENNSNESMAIELTVRERVMDENGKEEHPKTSQMTIFPPQIIIPAKEKRTIRVTWSGEANLEKEKAFRVIAEQLPLTVDNKVKKKSGIQMLMRYMAALYVTPKDATSKLSASVVSSKAGQLELKVNNSGSKHQVLVDPVVTIKSGSEKVTLKNNDLKGLAGENVLAGSSRVFSIKHPSSVKSSSEVIIKVDD